MVDVRTLAPPWMPPELIDAWFDEYMELGGSEVPGASVNAGEIIRSDTKYKKLYDQYFPGNRREDGSLRLPEHEYRQRVESYENALLGVNVNPDLFVDRFGALISGDVGTAEFTTRVESMYERVIEAAPGIRDFYAQNFALDMSDSAIVASFLDPDVGNKVLDRSITISEVGGEAAMRNFNLDVEFATRVQQAGVERGQAQRLFSQAAAEVPVLDVLARRHSDPDDDFDIEEFSAATIFDDPQERRRMRRLVAQERASFVGGATGLGMVEDRATGGLRGLGTR